MAKQRISANQVSVGTAGSGSVLSSNGTVAYWSNTLTVTANALVLSAGSNTAASLKFTSGNTLYIANAGVIEYTGTAFYATPVGQQRGVVPGMQLFMLNSNYTGANVATAQNTYGVGVTLSSNTIYAFEQYAVLTKSGGPAGGSMSFSFGGTSTPNYTIYGGQYASNTRFFSSELTSPPGSLWSTTNNAFTVTGGTFPAGAYYHASILKGIVSVNTGGTFIPQYSFTAASGNIVTYQGSYFSIFPIGSAGANISIGTWA